ncbi:hypothetical protein, partial [Polymorphobacter multimanifer]|uniref:hypothetical protein n=1 Tax=Polymorphobacter multimanifer TaxID=1070431 RepID=UPI001A9C9A47
LCPHPGVHALGRGDRRRNGRMITPNSGIASFHAPNHNKLTVPSRCPQHQQIAVLLQPDLNPLEEFTAARRS